MKQLRPFLLFLSLIGAMSLGAACAESYDNVETCTDYLLAIDCGEVITEAYAVEVCESYADLECDLTDFFDCAADLVECTDGAYLSGLDTAYASCAAKASCL